MDSLTERAVLPKDAMSADTRARLQESLQASSYSYTSGATHDFYHYPARFSPDFARGVIETFSRPGDWVLDPFAGGGTSIIEGLSAGRRMIGVDINTLAHFIANVRTTPLGPHDERAVRSWAADCVGRLQSKTVSHRGGDPSWNLPRGIQTFMAGAVELACRLPTQRQRSFARCVLLRLGQWALDCRDFEAPRRRTLAKKLPEFVIEMLDGLHKFTVACRAVGVRRSEIKARRLLFCRSAIGIHKDRRILRLGERPTLVLTSPPYPGVHVLYHRWQYRGRRETAAPYWIANIHDGYYESHYTGGSRTPTGQEHYFAMISQAFRSVRRLLPSSGIVAQLIGFSNAAVQLPRYLAAMEEAGFRERRIPGKGIDRLGRRVPNRKWYAKLQGPVDASCELLLLHSPRAR